MYTLGVMRGGVPLDSVFIGKRFFVRAEGTPLWEFLDEQKIAYDKRHFPFLTNHQKPRVKEMFDFGEYLKLQSRGEALGYLYAGLGKALNYVGPVLDLELKHGFNDHTDRHTLWVSSTGVELLQRCGLGYDGNGHFDSKTEVLMTLVGMMHDIGNFMGRHDHSTYSAWLLNRLFGNKDDYPAEWHAVQHAVLFHEEPVLVDLGINLEGGHPLQWALVAADKMHVGRDRVGSRSFESGVDGGALEEDAHILLNALIVRSTWYMVGRTFVWHLGFSIDQLEERFAAFTRGNKKRLWMPEVFYRLFVDRGVAYRDTFAKKFVEVYENRLRMLADSVFLLFPQMMKFEARLGDVGSQGGRVKGKEEAIWSRVNKRDNDRKTSLVEGDRSGEVWWHRG